jgi:hypothetical protein
MIEVYSEKLGAFIKVELNDEKLPEEANQCVGCSNSDYGG